MEYSKDKLSGWFDFDKQKPWVPGVYEVYHSDIFTSWSFWDGANFGWGCGEIDSPFIKKRGGLGCAVKKWRGLSSAPSKPAAPKKRGNKQKTMYVVQDVSRDGRLMATLATFDSMQNAERYATSIPCYTRIDKVRFRTPEA